MYKCPSCGNLSISYRQKLLSGLMRPVICKFCSKSSSLNKWFNILSGIFTQIIILAGIIFSLIESNLYIFIVSVLVLIIFELVATHFLPLSPYVKNNKA